MKKKALAVLLSVALVSCVSRRVDVEPVNTRSPVTVRSAVKAHLKDGSTVVYPTGVVVTVDALRGEGTRHDPTLTSETRVDVVPLADVVGVETYRTRVNAGETALLSTLTGAGAFVGSIALAVAIFGSCPTVYSESDGATIEEAELFSSSIAPLFEGRDLDRLRAGADAGGIVRLEIRNEAMETHYLNHLELLEVRHGKGEVVVPDADGLPLIVGNLVQPERARSRDGADVREVLARSDGRVYETERRRLGAATAPDMNDWIDLSVPVQPGAREAAIVFRMRNSLLNTILLYEVMLGGAGAASLDWLGGDLGKISTAVEVGRWHQKRAGLHVSVWQDGEYRPAVRIPDSGPISWHDVAAVIPVPAGETPLRLRLEYTADHWRIDRVGVSFATRRGEVRSIALSGVAGPAQTPEPEALANMAEADDRYLQTNPGQFFTAHFNAGPQPAAGERTFLLSSQGYYTEWIRGSWLRKATRSEAFNPSDSAVLDAMRRWSRKRDAFERQFLEARVPVR